jgi:cell division protein FtsL
MCGIFCLIVGAVLAVIWMRHRMRHLKAKEKRRAEVCASVRFGMARMTAFVAEHDCTPESSTWTVC